MMDNVWILGLVYSIGIFLLGLLLKSILIVTEGGRFSRDLQVFTPLCVALSLGLTAGTVHWNFGPSYMPVFLAAFLYIMARDE